MFKTTEQTIISAEHLEQTDFIQDYLFNLIRVHFTTVDLYTHVDKTKDMIADKSDTLPTFLLEPDELRDYMNRFEKHSTYAPLIDIDNHLFIYYNLLKTTKRLDGDIITFSIDLPIVQPDSPSRSFYKISVMETPFQAEDRKLLLNENLPSNLMYDLDNQMFFDMKDCKQMMGVYLCSPTIYKKSPCLDNLIDYTDWYDNCKFTNYEGNQELYNIDVSLFVWTGRTPTTMECKCSDESMHDRKFKIEWNTFNIQLSDEVKILYVPLNCTCEIQGYIIPRGGRVDSSTSIRIPWEINYNISDIDFQLKLNQFNKSTLLEYFEQINTDFLNLKEEFSKSNVVLTMARWSTPFQLAHIGLFSLVMVIIMIIGIMKCCKEKKGSNLSAALRGNNIRLNVISYDDTC